MARALTMDPRYFEDLYATSNDPWDFEHSWYERRKYALTLAALPKPRYHRAFEPGCSIGILSEGLAERCDELIALELIPAAAASARKRLSRHAAATVCEGAIPDQWPDGPFDLIVLSEVGYYLTADGLERTISRLEQTLQASGTLLSVHYLLDTDYPLTGAAVGARFREVAGLRQTGRYVEDAFELLVFES